MRNRERHGRSGRTAMALLRVVLVGCLGLGAVSPAAAASSPPLPPASAVPVAPTNPPPQGAGAGSPASPLASSPLPPSLPPLASSQPGTFPEGDGAASPLPSPGEPGPPAAIAGGGTRDALSYESDHEAVLLGWGIAVTPLSTQLPVFALRATTGCPLPAAAASAPDCPAVNVSAVDVRRWMARAWAVDAGLAFALGGGRDHGRLLDTYLAAGPRLGVAVLLGNWKHMAVLASPGASAVFFRPAGSAGTAYLVDVDAHLEAEVHFGFWGLPALSLSLRSGLGLRIEHAAAVTRWSFGPAGVTTLARTVNDVSLRYYF